MRRFSVVWLAFLALTAWAFTPACRAASAPYGGWDAGWSPDGKQISFIAGSPHRPADLWVMDAATGQARQLTQGGAHAPIWSHDGKRIYFTAIRDGRSKHLAVDVATGAVEPFLEWLPDGVEDILPSPDDTHLAYTVDTGKSRDLWVAKMDGSERKGLTANLYVRYFVWTRDSKRILFVPGRVIGTGLWIANPADGSVDQRFDGYAGAPSISPDGRWVAFPSPAGGNPHRLRLVSLADGTEHPLGILNADTGAPAWSVDSQRIVYSGRDRDGFSLFSIGVDGKGVARLTKMGLRGSRPSFSPNGKRILFVGYDNESCASDLFTISADGKQVRRLTTSPAISWRQAWSADGKKIAYLSTQGRRVQLRVRDMATGKVKDLSPVAGQEGEQLAWSPKGDGILVTSGSTLSLVRLTADPRKPAQATLLGDDTAASWFPDASAIALVTWRNKLPAISRSAPDGKDPKELTKPGEKDPGDFFPAVSPDGKQIAFARGGEVWVMAADGTNAHAVTAKPKLGEKESCVVQWPTWSRDGSRLLYTLARVAEKGDSYEIHLVTLADGSDKLVYSEPALTEFALFRDVLTTPAALSPDGKRVLFTSDREGGIPNVWSVNSDGSGLTALTKEGGIFPALSPDGRKLAYTSLGDRSEENKIVPLQ